MNAEARLRAWGVGALVVVRLAYLGQYLQLPFVFGPLFDSQVYLAQAAAVRAGRFGDASLLAFSPLYGYFLALLGPRPGDLTPLLVQLALGVVNVLLVARVARHCFGASAAPGAALALALYGPLLAFETKLMSETLGMALLLIGLERFASPAFARGRPGAIAASGSALALAVLARASLLFCLPLFLLAAALRAPPDSPWARGPALRRTLGLGLVLGALLTSYGAFTRAHSGLFVPVIMVSDTVAQTTRKEWTGDLGSLVARDAAPVGAFSVVEQAEARLAAIQRGEPDPADRRARLSGLDPLGWLAQMPEKVALTLRDLETSFDYAFYGERSEASVLYVTCATFGLLACVAALGAGFALRSGMVGGLLPLLPVLLGIFTTTTLFHPSTRYRLPLLVVFAPLTGLAWARTRAAWSAGQRALPVAVALLVLGFVVRGATRELAHPGTWQLRAAEAAAMANDLPECRARLRAALQAEPDAPSTRERAAYIAKLLPGCIPR